VDGKIAFVTEAIEADSVSNAVTVTDSDSVDTEFVVDHVK